MSKWKSTAEVVAAFKLKASSDDLSAVRDEVAALRILRHPDKFGGTFPSDEAKREYDVLNEALEFLSASQAMVPIAQLPAIIQALTLSVSAGTKPPLPTREEYRRTASEETRADTLLPKVGSGTFAAIAGALLAFSGSLKDNPVFALFATSVAARIVLLGIFFSAGMMFLMTWIGEKRASAWKEWLSTEEGLQHILRRLDTSIRRDPGTNLRFKFTDFCRSIEGRSARIRQEMIPIAIVSRLALPWLSSSRLSPSSVEKLARIHIAELLQRNVAVKSSSKGLIEEYEIEAEVLRHSIDTT